MHHHLTYALDKKLNRIVGVDDVVNGLACGCLCPHCKQQLIAKNGGTEREHHFAHQNNQECEKGRMTVLHLLAQQIIEDKKEILLPDYLNTYFCKENIGKIGFDKVSKEVWCDLQDGHRKPDCIGSKIGKDGKEHQLWIEIRVTHEVDEQKQKAIKDAKISCIEIDLSDMLKTDYSVDSITNRLIETKHDRKWINCPIYDELNRQQKNKHDQEEAERIKKENEERARQEAASRQQEVAERADRNAKFERVQKWYEDGNAETTKYFIAEIKNKPFRKDLDTTYFRAQNYLYDALVPNNDFLYYVDYSPKTENGLELFYTILHYYYNQTTYTDFEKIKQRLRYYQHKNDPLSAEEKIHLEQLISLKIVYILEKNRERHIIQDDDYKTIIKAFILNSDIRDGVLMLSSVLYHHVIGSKAKTFGKLTEEIIQVHSHLSKSYLSIIQSQQKHPNDYFLGDTNMLDELVKFVEHKQVYPNDTIDKIVKECYSFAFKNEKSELYNNLQTPKEDSTEKAWQELNEMYKNVH